MGLFWVLYVLVLFCGLIRLYHTDGPVAQLDRAPPKGQVIGSNPIGTAKKKLFYCKVILNLLKVNIIIKKIISGVDEAGRGSWAGPVVSRL